MKRRLITVAAIIAAVTGAATIPALADSAASSGTATPDGVPPQLVTAMQRDLQLSADQARARLANEERTRRVEPPLRKRLGDQFGGSWLTGDAGTLTVAVTDRSRFGAVRAAGATPRLVARSERQLVAVHDRLHSTLPGAGAAVPAWYVDLPGNTVVVRAHPGSEATVRRLVAAAGVASDAVRISTTTEAPRPLIDVIGGNAYYIGSGTRCSIGFSVNGGFVTAGHCGRTGATTSQPSGTFRGSSFPGNDYAWVQVAAGNTPRGLVNNYAGGTVSVAGSSDAPVGSSVCRSGSTTGWRCGTIQARNASVTYPQGTVTGLIRTSVCAEPGDSGGSLLSGSQAQGVTSGGSGNCSSGGTTYFQPVNEILQAYNLTLVTSGGGGPSPTPTGTTPPPGGCTGYSGTLSGTGAGQYQPNGSYYQSTASGTHAGCLDGPSGVDFDLYLQRWNGSSWSTVARSESSGPDERISYNGTAGYYRYLVYSYSGAGSYTMSITRP
ncbi:MAG: S1 family peptidase [Micromonosporaceae bacterium]